MADQESTQDASVSPLVKYSVFVGIFLVRILDCIPWLWGNLSIYVASYYYANGIDSSDVLINWLIVVNVSAFNFGILISGTIARTIGYLPTIFLAILLANTGLFLSCVTINVSAVALCTTFGGMTGLANGLLQASQLTLIVRWTKRLQGLAASCIPSSNILIAVLMNIVVSWYVNPHNSQPDEVRNKMSIFTEKDLVESVPFVFLYYAIWSSVINLSGFLLLRDRPGCKNILVEIIIRLQRLRRSTSDESVALTKSRDISSSSNDMTKDNDNNAMCLHHENRNNQVDILSSQVDVTPREALKRKEFYTLCFFGVVQTYAFFLLNTYYKIFGLLYIPDDHFLTTIVAFKCLATPVCTWFSGFCLDRFGVKPTIIVVSSVFGVISSLFYLTPANKWLYLFACVSYGASVFTLYCVTAACCVKVFGEKYFTSILGLTMVPCYVLTFTVPPLTGWIISTYGFFVLFISASGLAFFNVVVLIIGLPEG